MAHISICSVYRILLVVVAVVEQLLLVSLGILFAHDRVMLGLNRKRLARNVSEE